MILDLKFGLIRNDIFSLNTYSRPNSLLINTYLFLYYIFYIIMKFYLNEVENVTNIFWNNMDILILSANKR